MVILQLKNISDLNYIKLSITYSNNTKMYNGDDELPENKTLLKVGCCVSFKYV